MSTMDRYTYYYIIVILLAVRYIQGQTYSLSGSASYGIRGGDYRFTCQISGGNLPQGVEFKKDDSPSTICTLLLVGGRCDPSPTDTRYTCGCINGDRRSFYFNITNVQSTDAGNWTCKDNQHNGVSSQPVTLLVYSPPTITSLTSDATKNITDDDSTVTFTCSVDSPPSSVICWSRSQQGEQLYSGSQYTIPKASCQHTDKYTCTASNNIGKPVSKTIPLYVRCVPVLDHNQESITTISVGRGETGVLSIHVLAYPLPVYTWYYQLQDGSKQPVTDFRTRQEDVGLSSTLTIQDVTEDDGGKYIVYVNNSLGTRSTLFNLVVTSTDGVCTCSNQFENNDVVSRERGIGAAICLAICLLVFGIATVSLWIILKKNGKKICFKNMNGDKTVVHDTVSHDTGLDNINLSDTPHVYDQVNTGTIQASTTYDTGTIQTSTTESTNPGYINTSPYEVLDKQTIDQQPSTYQQLSPYQNLSEDKN